MASVDYRMARRALLRSLRGGLISRPDVCDAHPELIRAAKFIGDPVREACPVCDEREMRVVTYAYGPELKRDSGRVRRREDLAELQARYGEFVCYDVEVCMSCSWNHLVRSYWAGRKHAG